MLDFASLISSLTEQTKRRPYMQPEALPLPSETATNEIAMGAGQAFGKLGSQLMGGGGGYNTVDTTSIDEMARTQPIIRGGHKGFGLGDSALMGNADNTAEQYGDRAKGLISMGRGRRYGGPVNEGEPYVVGEEGMEIIVPKKDGEVIPTAEIATSAMAMSPEERATAQGIADEPANADRLESSTVNLGSLLIDPAQRQQTPVYGVNKTLDDDIGIQQDALRSAMDAPIEKQSKWKDAGAKIIQGLDAFFNGNRKPIEGWGKIKHDIEVDRANAKLNPLLGMKKNEQDRDLRQAQIDTIPIDDANRKLEIQTRATIAEENRKSQARGKIFTGKVFDIKNNAHRAMAKAAGLDPDAMASWDFNNAEKVTVNGQVFTRDRTTGEYTASNLPASEKDKIVAIDVAVPGEKNLDGSQKIRKFNVPQSQAATMSNSLQQAGMQIEASAERQKNQQDFTRDENEKNRTERRTQFLANFGQKVANDATKVIQDAAGDLTKLAQWKASQIRQIQSDTDLDADTKQGMIEAINNLQ